MRKDCADESRTSAISAMRKLRPGAVPTREGRLKAKNVDAAARELLAEKDAEIERLRGALKKIAINETYTAGVRLFALSALQQRADSITS